MKKKSSRRAGKGKAKAAPKRRKVKAKAAPKRRKRRAAKGKAKAAPKRRRRRAAKAKAAPKRRKRRAAKGKSKAAPKRRRRRAVKAKAAPKRRRRRAAKKSMKKSSSKTARAMGMIKGSRKNPGGILDFMKQEASDFMAMAPSIAVQLGTMAAIGFASSKASDQIKKMVRGFETDGTTPKAEPKDSFVYNYAGVLSSGAITLAAFAAMKMMKSEKSKAFTLPVLFGGMAATLVQVLAAVKVDPKKIEGQPAPATPLPKISLGQRLGLPIGEYTAVSGFLDVHGRRIAIDGFGDYVDQPLGALDIHRGRYDEGTVVSMGDYVDQPLGELTLREGRYQEGTVLGEIGQMSEGRQGGRALNSPGDDRVESYIDSGSLSGSVFD